MSIKKLLSTLVILSMTVSLVGCGKDSWDNNTGKLVAGASNREASSEVVSESSEVASEDSEVASESSSEAATDIDNGPLGSNIKDNEVISKSYNTDTDSNIYSVLTVNLLKSSKFKITDKLDPEYQVGGQDDMFDISYNDTPVLRCIRIDDLAMYYCIDNIKDPTNDKVSDVKAYVTKSGDAYFVYKNINSTEGLSELDTVEWFEDSCDGVVLAAALSDDVNEELVKEALSDVNLELDRRGQKGYNCKDDILALNNLHK